MISITLPWHAISCWAILMFRIYNAPCYWWPNQSSNRNLEWNTYPITFTSMSNHFTPSRSAYQERNSLKSFNLSINSLYTERSTFYQYPRYRLYQPFRRLPIRPRRKNRRLLTKALGSIAESKSSIDLSVRRKGSVYDHGIPQVRIDSNGSSDEGESPERSRWGNGRRKSRVLSAGSIDELDIRRDRSQQESEEEEKYS